MLEGISLKTDSVHKAEELEELKQRVFIKAKTILAIESEIYQSFDAT